MLQNIQSAKMKCKICNRSMKSNKCKCGFIKREVNGFRLWTKTFVIFLILLFIGIFVVASPSVYDYNSNITTSNNSITLNYNISTDDFASPSSIKFHWDGTNYSLYNDNLVLFYNFNNNSLLGENDTKVVDLSKYSNNGTVVGYPNASFTNNGKYNGGWNFNGVSTLNKINLFTRNFNESFTISVWIKVLGNGNNRYQDVLSKDYDYRIIYDNQTQRFEFNTRNSSNTDRGFNTGTNSINQSIWYHIVYEYNNSANMSYGYKNGILFASTVQQDLRQSTTIFQLGRGSASGFQFNGTIDDFMVYNRSLSAQEISQLYKSQLTKYNSQNWTFTTNQTLNYSSSILNASSSTKTNNYYLCASNSSGSENCSTQRTITQTIPSSIITANFTTSVGVVRNDFYGIGLQSPKLVSGSIDTNCDGTAETLRNYTWQKETFLNNKAKIEYMDASLENYYEGNCNFDFEQWSNTSLRIVNSSQSSIGSRCNSLSYSGTVNGTSYAVQGRSGDYALQINSTIGSSLSNFHYQITPYVYTGNNYNFSIWLKGGGAVNMRIENNTYNAKVSLSVTLTNTWTLYSVNYTINEINQTYRMLIDNIDNYDNVSIDDYNIKENNKDYRWWREGNATPFQDQLDLDYSNNVTSVIIMDYMPSFIANRSLNNSFSSLCLDDISDTDTSDCMAYNITIFTDIEIDFYKRIDKGRNVTRIQTWNEPDGSFFEDNLATNGFKPDFVILFNETYLAFQNYNSGIKIDGYRGLSGSVNSSGGLSNFAKMMLSNLSNQFETFGYHPYDSAGYINSNLVSNELSSLFTQCASYGAECSHISLDEWQPSYPTRNESNASAPRYYAEIAFFLQDILNHYPENVSQFPFHWDDGNSYFNCPSRYSEYPSFWSSVSEAGLDNPTPTYYPPYNVTKNFATYCPANGTVYQSLSVDSTLKVVSCKSSNKTNIIDINTGIESRNRTLNVSGTGLFTLTDQNKNIYNSQTELFKLGISDSYNIFYLGNPVLNVSLSSGIYGFNFRPLYYNQKNVWAVNQTNSKGVINITNIGQGTANTIEVKINQTISGWSLECNNRTSGSWLSINTSYRNIYSNLSSGESFMIWCRADLNYPNETFKGRFYVSITS